MTISRHAVSERKVSFFFVFHFDCSIDISSSYTGRDQPNKTCVANCSKNPHVHVTAVAQSSPFRFGGVVNPPEMFHGRAPILKNIDKSVNGLPLLLRVSRSLEIQVCWCFVVFIKQQSSWGGNLSCFCRNIMPGHQKVWRLTQILRNCRLGLVGQTAVKRGSLHFRCLMLYS